MAGAFGTQFASFMASTESNEHGVFPDHEILPFGPISISPAAHALHYASTCFEGLKAHRGKDGVVRIFRLDDHIKRFQNTANIMHLPAPSTEQIRAAIIDAIRQNLDEIPASPAAGYIRPVLFGTEPNVGAAGSSPKTVRFMVLVSPVENYFVSDRTLKLAVVTDKQRTVSDFGVVKAGANYALANVPTFDSRERYPGIDQVLFAPQGVIQETGASNFIVFLGNALITPALNNTFLHGVTRDSILTIARDEGMEVSERPITVSELVGMASEAHAAVSGTAAIMGTVGTLYVDGDEITLSDGEQSSQVEHLRALMQKIQWGESEDKYGWTTEVHA